MNELEYLLESLGRTLTENPARLLPVLAIACVVTLIIAVTKDALARSRAMQHRPAVVNATEMRRIAHSRKSVTSSTDS